MKLRWPMAATDETRFYGWWYAGIGSTLNALGSGFYGRGFGVYFLPLSRDLGLSHTSTSLIFGFASIEAGIQAPLTGYLIDRFGARLMMLFGAALAGLGFLLLPLANDFLSFVLIYVGVIGLGINAGFHSAVGAVVNQWFLRHRGLAFGITSVGIALGGGILTPIMAYVVLNFGWRPAVTIAGLVILIVALPLAFLVRDAPEDVGQFPDGRRPPNSESHTKSSSRDFTVREAFSTSSYWLLAAGISLRIAVQAAIIVHIVPLMVWKGLGEAHGAIIIATISFSAVGTRLLMGWWGDRWDKPKVVVIGMFAGIASVLILLFAPGELWIMMIFAVVFSLTDGAAGLTWAMIGDFFGRASFATLRGVITFVVSLGSLASPVFAGRVFDVTQSYYWALLPLVGVYAVASIVFIVIRNPRPTDSASTT